MTELICKDPVINSTMYYENGRKSMAFSIRLTKQERDIAESYAKLHGLSLGEAFKQALFEKIEDELDIKDADEAYAEYLKNPDDVISHEELWKEVMK